jgi:hypothetical protein
LFNSRTCRCAIPIELHPLNGAGRFEEVAVASPQTLTSNRQAGVMPDPF